MKQGGQVLATTTFTDQYGTPWIKTPAFDRVAREGILFNHAYTPNAKCAPSRACILTGRNSWQLKAAANHICYFPPEFKGWGEALAWLRGVVDFSSDLRPRWH